MSTPESLRRHGFSPNVLDPQGTGANQVLIVAEAPGEQEDETGQPFCPAAPAGSILERAIRRVGMTRDQFAITNVVPARPPNNWLEKAPWEEEAISWGLPILEDTIKRYQPRAILALGGVAIRATTGLAGPKLGVSHLSGYVLPSRWGIPVVASFHPSFLRRGKMSLFGCLMRYIRLAALVAREGRQAVVPDPDNPPAGYITHPTENQAEMFADAADVADWVLYDIETYYSNAEEEAEEHDSKDIKSIQFALTTDSGIYMPWREPYIRIAKRVMANRQRKAGFNNWRFDDPALRAVGVDISGEIVDCMWMAHFAQPDLPRGLQFTVAHQGPNLTQPTHSWKWPWKHLDAAHPAFYGIVDVDSLAWLLTY